MNHETKFFDKANKLRPINTVSVSMEILIELSKLDPETCFKEYRKITEEKGLSYDRKYDIVTQITEQGITLANIPSKITTPVPLEK